MGWRLGNITLFITGLYLKRAGSWDVLYSIKCLQNVPYNTVNIFLIFSSALVSNEISYCTGEPGRRAARWARAERRRAACSGGGWLLLFITAITPGKGCNRGGCSGCWFLSLTATAWDTDTTTPRCAPLLALLITQPRAAKALQDGCERPSWCPLLALRGAGS